MLKAKRSHICNEKLAGLICETQGMKTALKQYGNCKVKWLYKPE